MFGIFQRSAFLSPITLYIGLAIMAASFYGGWTVQGWRLDAKAASFARQVQKDKDTAAADAKKKLDAAEEKGRTLATQLAAAKEAINTGAAMLQKDIADAKAAGIAAGRRACALSNDYVRLYNSSLHPDDYSTAPRSVPAGSPGGAGAAQADSGADEWDALAIGAENNRRWASCRKQLNALIDFELDDTK